MKRAKRRVSKWTAPIRSNERQTLGERIRWLRAKQKPFMTQQQLADRARVQIDTLVAIERGDPKHLNVGMKTLRQIAHALDCKVYINLRSKPYPRGEECLPLDHDLPPLPKRKGKTSELGHTLAARYGNYPWKNYRRKKRPSPDKSTSDTSCSPTAATIAQIDEETG